MNNQLVQLSALTTVVADTGDIEAIVKYQPEDATTNPSLILKAAKLPDYRPLLKQAIIQAKSETLDKNNWVEEAVDRIAVKIGNEILQVIPGRVSTEVDARLSYDTQASIEKARKLIKMYGELGIPSHRILIKLAATWQGIRAAEQLEKEGIQCNLTLLFSFAQARACAEAGVFLISPFVGRILDWHKSKENRDFTANEDPGVKSVKKIFDYYKSHGYETVVMGASFRNVGEILALAGCDKLTISPQLLDELSQSTQVVSKQLSSEVNIQPQPEPMTHAEFLWQHNLDSMAVEKLSEGIRLFAQDQIKLEEMIKKDFG